MPIDIEINADDSFVKGSIGDKFRMSGVGVVEYDYDGNMVLLNKDTQELLDMDDGTVIAVWDNQRGGFRVMKGNKKIVMKKMVMKKMRYLRGGQHFPKIMQM